MRVLDDLVARVNGAVLSDAMDADVTPSPFDAARAAIAAGESARTAASVVVAAMTPDEKLWCLDGDAPTWVGLEFLGKGGYHEAPFYGAVVDRVGMPGIAFSDGPRGVVIGNATCFPVSMARGATWDPELEERLGDVIGRELRASGATLYGGVCVNLLRHPAWGRAQETYGEDPHHVGEMGAALTRGIQRHAMATVKHYAANSMENARFRVDVEVDDEALHEVYLPHFKRIIDEGVACVMSAYNQVNGEWCGDSRVLLTDILRGEWGFDGFVISDWIFGMRDAAASLHAGLDIEMPWRMIRYPNLPAALESGEASWDDVDLAVTNVISTLLRFDAVLSTPNPPMSVVGATEHVAFAREIAARSVVLLRNEPVDGRSVLPLDADALSRIAVIGELADQTNLGDGGSSDVYSLDNVNLLDGIRAAAGGADVVHDDGSDTERAAAAAGDADVAIVVVGYTADDEGEFIGDTGTDLSHLFPTADEPEVVEAFRASLDHALPTVRPDHLRGAPGARVLERWRPSVDPAPPERPGVDRCRGRCQRPNGRGDPGRQRCGDERLAALGGGRRPGLVRRANRPGMVSPTCCSETSTRRPGCRSRLPPTSHSSPSSTVTPTMSCTTTGTAGGTPNARVTHRATRSGSVCRTPRSSSASSPLRCPATRS